ncbi:hypothetical protein PIB30_017664 [Stylosanthes scabra]|uniref:Uncharacterized protein n=1 Tax=Stylosanthes scabra TaxID=79078 RepID=A0ABU6Y865_9FABA|nr:hypothetical protein [Stylosanthes scabra]
MPQSPLTPLLLSSSLAFLPPVHRNAVVAAQFKSCWRCSSTSLHSSSALRRSLAASQLIDGSMKSLLGPKDVEHITSAPLMDGDREEDDPYIETSQARIVYFVHDEVNMDWSVVVHLKPRDLYDMGGKENDEAYENNEPLIIRAKLRDFFRMKNLLKVAAASSSQDKSAAAASSSQACQQASTNSPIIQPSITSSTNSGTSSRTSSTDPTTSEDSSGARRKRALLAKDVHNLAEGLRIIVNFHKKHASIGEAAGLLAGVRFCFKESDLFAKHFLLQSLSKKWREHRLKLWNEFYDPRFSKTQLIKNVPANIEADQWALIYVRGIKKFDKNKQFLTLQDETGKKVSRVEMWGITHKKKDGSYVNEQAEKIKAHCTQQSVDSTINSPLDALGVVLGKEHLGRVRGLGMGIVPTVAFKNNTTRIFSDELRF